MYSTADSSGRLMCRHMRLAEIDFELKYKPGASYHLPDFLSREGNNVSSEAIDEDSPCLAVAETPQGVITKEYTGTSDPNPYDFQDIIEEQQSVNSRKYTMGNITNGTAKSFFLDANHAL